MTKCLRQATYEGTRFIVAHGFGGTPSKMRQPYWFGIWLLEFLWAESQGSGEHHQGRSSRVGKNHVENHQAESSWAQLEVILPTLLQELSFQGLPPVISVPSVGLLLDTITGWSFYSLNIVSSEIWDLTISWVGEPYPIKTITRLKSAELNSFPFVFLSFIV